MSIEHGCLRMSGEQEHNDDDDDDTLFFYKDQVYKDMRLKIVKI